VSFDLGRLTALSLNRLYFGRSYAINLEAERAFAVLSNVIVRAAHPELRQSAARDWRCARHRAGENPCRRPFACRRRDRQDRAPLSTDRPSCCRRICDQRRVQTIENGVAMITLSICHPTTTLHSPPLVVRGKCKGTPPHSCRLRCRLPSTLMPRVRPLRRPPDSSLLR